MKGKKWITLNPHWVGERYGRMDPGLKGVYISLRSNTLGSLILQDMFDLPLHMGRNQIEESLRNKMAFIKVL